MSLGSPIAAQDRKESTGKAASAFMDAGEQEDPIPDLDETLTDVLVSHGGHGVPFQRMGRSRIAHRCVPSSSSTW